jgi:Zn finger protein HypA/HybF involved in hydrogenase expression
MKDVSKKGQVCWWIEGKAVAGWCKECGEFTLDTSEFLCAGCRLHRFVSSTATIMKGGIDHA